MTAARELQSPAATPEPAEEPRTLRVAGPGGVEQLQRTIGNRAVGSLLRRRSLARQLGGAPQQGQLDAATSTAYDEERSQALLGAVEASGDHAALLERLRDDGLRAAPIPG